MLWFSILLCLILKQFFSNKQDKNTYFFLTNKTMKLIFRSFELLIKGMTYKLN